MRVPLRFNAEDQRWYIGETDLHCGNCFLLYPDSADLPAINVRIEHNRDGWYFISPYGLLNPSTRMAELEGGAS